MSSCELGRKKAHRCQLANSVGAGYGPDISSGQVWPAPVVGGHVQAQVRLHLHLLCICKNYTTEVGNCQQVILVPRSHFNLCLRGAPAHPELVEGRGNLDEVEHASANRRCYADEIATLRSQMTKWVRMRLFVARGSTKIGSGSVDGIHIQRSERSDLSARVLTDPPEISQITRSAILVARSAIRSRSCATHSR